MLQIHGPLPSHAIKLAGMTGEVAGIDGGLESAFEVRRTGHQDSEASLQRFWKFRQVAVGVRRRDLFVHWQAFGTNTFT